MLENTKGELFWELSAGLKLQVPAGIQTQQKKKKLNSKKRLRFTAASSWCYLSYTNTCKTLRPDDHYRSQWMLSVHFKPTVLLHRRKLERSKGKLEFCQDTKCLQISPPGPMAQAPHSRPRRPQVSWLPKAKPVLKELLPHKTRVWLRMSVKPTYTIHISARTFLYVLINSFFKSFPGQNYDFSKAVVWD